MTIENVWYDRKLTNNYGNHKFSLLLNNEDIPIVKCSICLESRLYLSLMGIETCKGLKSEN